jgi:hypothetical protein
MGSFVMIYIPSFIKTGSGIQKLRRGDTRRNTDRMEIAWARNKFRLIKYYNFKLQ